MPIDTEITKPVLIHVNPNDWETFKRLCGNRQASMRLRRMIRTEIRQMKAVQRAKTQRNLCV